MMKKQIKSRERVISHGEVFTADREVVEMCDLVSRETERIDSRFLEPACGDGNFLVEIIRRKLNVVRKKYSRSPYDYERNSLLALSSVYGIDKLYDNVISCRNRLFNTWEQEYSIVCKKQCNEATKFTAKFILEKNIVCGNALNYSYVDESGSDTVSPIVFSEWTFPFNDARMQRKDYLFDELISGGSRTHLPKKDARLSKADINDEVGKFQQQYIFHYRRVEVNEQ